MRQNKSEENMQDKQERGKSEMEHEKKRNVQNAKDQITGKRRCAGMPSNLLKRRNAQLSTSNNSFLRVFHRFYCALTGET